MNRNKSTVVSYTLATIEGPVILNKNGLDNNGTIENVISNYIFDRNRGVR